MDERDVGLQIAFFEEARNFVQENGNAVSDASVHRGPHITADEQAEGPEVL